MTGHDHDGPEVDGKPIGRRVILGLLFTLQGAGVISGSAMSGTTFWTVAGPIIIVVGLVVAAVGVRGRRRR